MSETNERNASTSDGATKGSDEKGADDGTDNRVTEWFGQNVDADAQLAEILTDRVGAERAEQEFEQRTTREDVEDARRGDEIDPELGEAAYQDDQPGRAAER